MRIFGVVCIVLSAACAMSAQPATVSPADAFWSELSKLCGRAFSGTVTADTSNSPDFAGKPLVMHVRSCEGDRIRIPFFVGDDRSRTWVLTRKDGRIQLKHDHRHADGKPDAVTMYGGATTNAGTAARQMFPADQQTVDVVPAAAANVWWIDLTAGDSFVYNLRRMGSDRYFSVRFDLKAPVKIPAAPWGWKD